MIEQYLAPLRNRLEGMGHRIESIRNWMYVEPSGECSFWLDGHVVVKKADGLTYKLYIHFQHYSSKQAFFTANVEGLAQQLFADLYPEYTCRHYFCMKLD